MKRVGQISALKILIFIVSFIQSASALSANFPGPPPPTPTPTTETIGELVQVSLIGAYLSNGKPVYQLGATGMDASRPTYDHPIMITFPGSDPLAAACFSIAENAQNLKMNMVISFVGSQTNSSGFYQGTAKKLLFCQMASGGDSATWLRSR